MTSGKIVDAIRYVYFRGFSQRNASEKWGSVSLALETQEKEQGYMPDDVTRDFARRMHYAAFRVDKAKGKERHKWLARYYDLRDRIVLGNRKLIFGAVRRRFQPAQAVDDLIGECYIVMIRAVAAYNPWLGIRFSTYAFTCLMRALSRLNLRSAGDKLHQHLSLDQVQPEAILDLAANDDGIHLDEYLADAHPLLSLREKVVLRRRFQFHDEQEGKTLEEVGRHLGISKERVRQVQATALDKLREVLLGAAVLS